MFKKIVSGVVSAAIAAGIMPQIQIVGSAEVTPTSGRTAYEGYDDTNANYLEYDESMTPDMSWYSEATGTEEDPYIIDSAEDLLSLHYLSQYDLGEFMTAIDYSLLSKATGIYESLYDSVYIPAGAKYMDDVYVIQSDVNNRYAKIMSCIRPYGSLSNPVYNSSVRSYIRWLDQAIYFDAPYVNSSGANSSVCQTLVSEYDACYYGYLHSSNTYQQPYDYFTWDVKILDTPDADGNLQFEIKVDISEDIKSRYPSRPVQHDYTKTCAVKMPLQNGTLVPEPFVDPTTQDNWVTAVSLTGKTVCINLNDEVPAGNIYRVGMKKNGRIDFTSDLTNTAYDSDFVYASIWPKRELIYSPFEASGILDTSWNDAVSSKIYSNLVTDIDISDLYDYGVELFRNEIDFGHTMYGKHVNDLPAYKDEVFYTDMKSGTQLRLLFDTIEDKQVLCIQQFASDNGFLDASGKIFDQATPKSCVWLDFDGVDFSLLQKYIGFKTNTVTYSNKTASTAPDAEMEDTKYDYYAKYSYIYPIYSFCFEDVNGNPIEIVPSRWCFSDSCSFTSWNACNFVENSEYSSTTYPKITMYYPEKRVFMGFDDLKSCGDYISYATNCDYWVSTVDGHTEKASMVYLGKDLLDNDIELMKANQAKYTTARAFVEQCITQVSDPTFENKYFKIAANFKWDGPALIMTEPANSIFKGTLDFDNHILYNLSETDALFKHFEGDIRNAVFVSNGGEIIEYMTGNLDNITFITPGCLKSVSNTPKEYNEFHESTGSYIYKFGHSYTWSESQAEGFVPERVSATNIKIIRNIGQGMYPFEYTYYADTSNVDSLFVDDSVIVPTDKTLFIGTYIAYSMQYSTLKCVTVDADTDNLGATLNLNAGNVPLAKTQEFIARGQYSDFEDIWVKDFNICAPVNYYRYLYFEHGTIKNVIIEFSSILAEDKPWTENQSMYLTYSTVDNLVCRGTTSLGFGYFYVCDDSISNSEIGLNLSENTAITTCRPSMTPLYFSQTSFDNCEIFLHDLSGTRPVIDTSKLIYAYNYAENNIKYKDTSFDISVGFKGYYISDLVRTEVTNCSFRFKNVYTTGSGSAIFGDYYCYNEPSHLVNCNFTIDGLDSQNSALFGAILLEDSIVCLDNVKSFYSLGENTDIKNCKIDLNYTSVVHPSNDDFYNRREYYTFCGSVEDTDIIITAPDGATGTILSPVTCYSAKNLFVCMDLSNTDINVIPRSYETSTSATTPSVLFGSVESPYSRWNSVTPGSVNSTYIFKGNLKRNNSDIVTVLGSHSYDRQTKYENVNVILDINNLVGFTDKTPSIGGVYTYTDDTLIKAFNFIGEFADDPIVLGIYERDYGNLMADSVSVISNSANPKQVLIEFQTGSFWGSTTSVVSNSLLYTPNNIADYSAERSGIAEAGISYGYYSPAQHNAYSAWATSDYANIFHNCYVGKGQSIQYYNPVGGPIDMTSSPVSSQASRYPDAVWDATEDREYAGIKQLETDDILSGEAAYLLDKGFAYNRRGYNWTVYDEVEIIDPQTSEVITTIPAHTGPVGMYIPEQYLGGAVLADEPIYKLTVKPASNGEIKITGLQDLATADGSVYAKRGSYLQAEETAYADDVSLIYALESLNGGSEIRIPNQNTGSVTFALGRSGGTGYTINGYKLPGADISITPVFKIARNITIDVNDAAHGNIVPSDYISAEGEKVYLSLVADSGYTIGNLYWNTVSDPDTTYPVDLTAMEIVMPADDIVIHGTVSPMECGITKFNVLGFDGVIDQVNGVIDVWVPRIGQLNHTIPEITYFGDYMTPSETTFVDLTTPCSYTVYKDAISKTYDINIHQSEYSMRIYSFKLNGVEGEINQASQKIVVRLPMDTDISNLVPEIVYSAETITPSDTVAQDFRMPIVYTLYTTSMTPVPYTVEVVLTASDEAIITNYTLAGFEGIINQDTKQIIVNVPKALNLEHIRPNLVEYVGKRITPNKVATINASTPVEYVVTAQNGNVATYTLTANRLSDNTAKITQFTLGGVDGIIDEENHTISVVVPATTSLVDVAPDILTYEGKSIYPNKTLVQDFSQPVEYTVVAVDNTEVTYTVTVTKASNEALITEFAVYGINGTIDQTAKTISVVLPYGYSIDNLVPSTLTYSNYAVLSPSKTVARDFTNPVVYSVTSQDGTVTNDYTVTITNRAMYDNLITKYTLDGVEGKITNIGSDSGTIHITVNEKNPPIDFSNKTPDEILISELATIDKDTSVAVDYINGIPEYTVTGLYNGARTYKVYLTVVPRHTDPNPNPDPGSDPNPNPGTDPNPNPGTKPELSDDCSINYYQALGIIGTIDQNSLTITMRIPENLKDATRGIIPDFISWAGKNLSPTEKQTIDLVDGMKYVVTAESGKTKVYTVRIVWLPGEPEIIPSKDCSIMEYYANGVKAAIDQNKLTITFKASETDKDKWTNVIPDRIVWIGSKLTPAESDAVDLADKTVYRVYAEDQNVFKDYSVMIDWIPADKPTDNPDTGVDVTRAVFISLILASTVLVVRKKRRY